MLKKVLIVDDSDFVLKMYKLVFMPEKDCRIIFARNGLEALDKLSQEDGVDLIILDINMPVMDGVKFLQTLNKEGIHTHIPVIIASTEGKEDDVARGLTLGARGYLKKPFLPRDLHSLINKIFERGAASVA